MDTAPVTCPSCFEVFDVVVPPHGELPTEFDYDCEICCRPMVIGFTQDSIAEARGLAD